MESNDMTDTQPSCRNCNTPLSGEYCSYCGQRERGAELTMGHVVGELADELVSWDSRLWRTLVPLLFRPGFLAAEFNAGRRARYVPPFRLYLIISFVLFLVVSLLASGNVYIETDEGIVIMSGSAVKSGTVDPRQEKAAQTGESGDRVVAPITISGGENSSAGGPDFNISLADENSPRWLRDLDQRMEDNARQLADNPAGFFQLLVEYLPAMMFLLLPLFALMLKFCYLFSPFYYLQHLVFSLHFFSFGYLLYLVGVLVSNWLYQPGIGLWLLLVFVLHLPFALMRTYGSGLAGAVARSMVILITDGLFLVVAFVLLALVALAMM